MALTFLNNSSYSVFLTALFFTTPFSLLKATGIGVSLSTTNLPTLLSKLLKPIRIFFDLSISNLSAFDFKPAKSAFLAASVVSTPVAFSSQILLHN